MFANVSDVNIFLKILWNFQRWFCDHAFCETPFCGVNNWIDTYFLTSHVTIWIRYCLAFDDQTLQLEVHEWYVINIQVAGTYKDVLLYYRSTIHCTRYSPWHTGFEWVRANVHIIGFVTISSFFLPTSARNNKRWDYWIRDLNLIGIRFLTAEKVKRKKDQVKSEVVWKLGERFSVWKSKKLPVMECYENMEEMHDKADGNIKVDNLWLAIKIIFNQ